MSGTDEIYRMFAGDRRGASASMFRTLCGLFLLCLLVRLFIAVNTVVVDGDATSFLWGVRRLQLEGFSDMLKKDKALFQILVYVAEPLFGDPVAAGKAVTALFSSLTVVFLYPLFRGYVSENVALFAALLYVFHPTIADEHSKVITDGTFTCFFIAAIYLFDRYVWADRPRKQLLLLLASFAASVLALLTRPEGVLLFALHSVVLFVQLVRSGETATGRWIAGSGLFLYVLLPLTGGLLLAGDRFMDILMNPGAFSKSLGHVIDTLTGRASVSPVQKWPWYAEMFDEFLELSYYHLNLFLLLGLFVVEWTRSLRSRIRYFSYIVCYYLAVYLSIMGNPSSGYANERYFMPGFILLLPIVSAGVCWTYERIKVNWNRPATAKVVLMIVLLALLPRTLEKGVEARNTSLLGLRKGGEWIREHVGPNDILLLSLTKRPAYYSGVDRSQVERIDKKPLRTLDDILNNTTGTYLVFSEKSYSDKPVLKSISSDPRFTLLYTYGKDRGGIHTTYVYRISRQ